MALAVYVFSVGSNWWKMLLSKERWGKMDWEGKLLWLP
jgi:hypothetical protein